jgi:hypothetical protein
MSPTKTAFALLGIGVFVSGFWTLVIWAAVTVWT